MQKINFTIDIKAPKEKVWSVLFDDKTYRQWTSVFAEGSYAVTDWKEGSKTLFLAGDSGMVSVIEKNIPNEFMSIKHLGTVTNGIEDTESEKVKEWSGAHENYTLKENDGVTTLSIEMDTADEHKDYFDKAWPAALEKVKQLSE